MTWQPKLVRSHKSLEKTRCFSTFLVFCAPASSFFWFFLFSELLSFAFLFSDSSHLCFSRSLTSKLPSINIDKSHRLLLFSCPAPHPTLPQVVAQRFFGTELMPLWRRHGAAIRALEAAEEEAESRWRQAQARRFAQRLWVHFVSIYVIHCHTVLYHRFMSYYIIVDIRSFHFISFRFVSYHFISYHI